MADLAASPPPPLPLPFLPEELILEILLRFPPEPIHLLRASLVCNHWRGLIRDAHFLRRFRAFHGGAPPVLGFFTDEPDRPFFSRTSSFFAFLPHPIPDIASCRFLDCRHGRALLLHGDELLVWDPITGDNRRIPMPLHHQWHFCHFAVLCAAGHADHADCHSSPFLVADVCNSEEGDYVTYGCVYSSVTGAWGDVISIPSDDDDLLVKCRPTALVGSSLYWPHIDASQVLEFDLDRQSLDIIQLPSAVYGKYEGKVILMPAEDGGIGFVGVANFKLHFWSRMVSPDGVVEWEVRNIIDLEELLPEDAVFNCYMHDKCQEVVGFSEDADVVFVYLDLQVYMIHVKTMQFEKIVERGSFDLIYAYTSFYTSGT